MDPVTSLSLPIGFFVAVVLTFLTLPALILLAERVQAVAVPDGRKLHDQPTPQIGGVGIFIGVTASLTLVIGPTSMLLGFLLGAACVFAVGLVDDHREVHYLWKLLFQFLGATIALISLLHFGQLELRLSALELTLLMGLGIVFLVGTSNALNLSDGLDGLAGGIGILSGLALTGAAYQAWLESTYTVFRFPLSIGVLLVGGIFGFMRFNNHPARIFMGDGGAYFIGFSLAYLGVCLIVTEGGMSPLPVLFFLGLPVYDVAAVVARRLLSGTSPFLPDRNHFHHRVMDSGLSHAQTVVAAYAVHIVFILFGFLLLAAPIYLQVAGYLALVVLIEATHQTGFRWLASRADRFITSEAGSRRASENSMAVAAFVAVVLLLLTGMVGVFEPPTGMPIIALLLLVFLLAGALSEGQAQTWSTRMALYLLGVYLVWICDSGEANSIRVFQLLLFGLLSVWLVVQVSIRQSAFRLTPLDVLILLILGVLVGGFSSGAYAPLAISGIKVMIWFYSVEVLLALPAFGKPLRLLAGAALMPFPVALML